MIERIQYLIDYLVIIAFCIIGYFYPELRGFAVGWATGSAIYEIIKLIQGE